MKNFKLKWLLLSFILSIASINQVWATARTYDGTKKLYIKNFRPWDGSGDQWIDSGTYGWAHMWGGTGGEQDLLFELVSGTANTAGAIYAVTPPAGTYTTLILARSTSASSNDWKNGQSKDIDIEERYENIIDNWSPSGWGVDNIHWSKYAPTPALYGGMNNWDPVANPFVDGSVSISLSANTEYQFKVIDEFTTYGYGGSDGALTVKRQLASTELSSSGYNMKIRTSCAGSYTFTFNTSDHKLSVTYPNSQKVYFYKNGANWDHVYAHVYDDDTWKMDNWPGIEITSNYEHGTYYINTDGYTYVIFNNGSSGDGNQTGEIEIGDNDGKCIYGAGGTTWKTLPPTISGEWKYFPGQTISLTATEYGERACTYQWQKHNGSSWTNISGATSSTFTKSNCERTDAGKYRCKVTYTNDSEVVYSCADSENGFEVKIYTLNGGYDPEGDMSANDITWTSGTTGQVKLTLNANDTYYFKVTDNFTGDETWYGNGDGNYIIQDITNWECGKDNYNCRLFTGPAGEYTFTVDIAHVGEGSPYVKIGVSYPEVAHPNDAYVYINKWWDHLYVHWWYTDGEGDHELTTWGEDPELTTYTEICDVNYYYFPIVEGYPKFIAKDATGEPTNTTGNQTTASNGGKYITHNAEDGWHWESFNVHTITFEGNENTGGSMSDVYPVCDASNQTLASNGFTRTGYSFANWTANVDVTVNSATVTAGDPIANGATLQNLTSDITLTAQWNPNTQTFNATSGNNWSTAANWTDRILPTLEHPVVINAPVEVDDDEAVAASVAFSGSGSLTIESTGALEVAGTIINSDASKIVINSSDDHQGALIFDSDGGTKATVNLTLDYTGNLYKHIAIPVPYVDVSAQFSGEGVYTYGWKYGEGWERRGYYSGFAAFESILIKGQTSPVTFTGNLVSTGNRSYTSLAHDDSKPYGNVHMFGNSWTAPIEICEGDLTNASVHILLGTTNKWDAVTVGEVIPAMQAFAVVAGSGGGSYEIDYDEAVRNAASPNEALKAPKRYADENPEPIIVYVSGNEMQTRLRFFEDATRFSDEFDAGWDAFYLEGEDYAGELYAIGKEKMNVLATAELEGTVVGFIPGQATDYTISFGGDGKGYYLNDVKTGKSTLIDEANSYEFTSDESTNATRFVISKIPMQPTGIDDVVDGTQARKQLIDGALYIIRDGRIYTATGNAVK